jgi:hypothetical protein
MVQKNCIGLVSRLESILELAVETKVVVIKVNELTKRSKN